MIAVAALVLLAQTAAPMLATLPGQEGLLRAHREDFPKKAWVVSERVPVSDSPQLGGRIVAVLEKGDEIEIAGVGGQTLNPRLAQTMDDVLVLGVGLSRSRRAGYVSANHIAVVETTLGRCWGDALLFASVIGLQAPPGAEGLVARVAVWARRPGATPELVLLGPNLPPGVNALVGEQGSLAVQIGGSVVVTDSAGSVTFASPAGETWTLDQPVEAGFELRGPDGVRLVSP